MTSISEKLVSFYAKVSWEYEKFAKVLRGFNWEGRCGRIPHKKVREGKRYTNFTPRCCLFDYLTRSRPHKKVRKGKRDTNFTPLNRSIHSSGSLLAAEGSGHQPPHKNVCGETCDKTLPEAILAGRAQRPNPPKTRRARGALRGAMARAAGILCNIALFWTTLCANVTDTSSKSSNFATAMDSENNNGKGIRLWTFFTTFFRIGLFTIGGGYAMIPLIEAEVVDKHKWLGKEDFLDLLAVSQTVPGVFAINMSINIGYRLRKMGGAIACAVGTALPSFVIILLIALFFQQFENNAIVEAIFKGIRPAVVALIAAPCIRLARTAGITLSNVWIPLGAVMLIWIFKVSPVYIILTICVCGFIYARFIKPQE